MASTVSSLAHAHLMTAKTRTYNTRTRQTSVKYQLSDDDNEGDDRPDSTQGSTGSWYEVKRIIGETKGKYKILWEGVDPKTNRPWPAEWINKSEVTAPAIAEWEESKRAKAATKITPSASRGPSTNKRTWTNSTAGHGIKVRRILVVHDTLTSESEYQPTQSVSDPIVSSPPGRATQRSIRRRERSALEDEIEDSFERGPPQVSHSVLREPLVEVNSKSTFDRTEYTRFSDLPSSQPALPKPNWDQGASQDSASYAAQLPPFQSSTRILDIDQVIPDSQPSYPSSAYLSVTVEPGDNSIKNNLDKEDNEEDDSDPFLAEGAQPRSQWNEGVDRFGDFTDHLGPLLEASLGSISAVRQWEQGLDSAQDEYLPLSFASQPAELDTPVDSSILQPPSRSLSPYAELSDDDIPPPSLSNSLMADQQQSFRTPPSAGSQSSSTSKPSLRERLAQARLGFNDAVSAFRSTPAVEAPSARTSQPPPITAQSLVAAPTPQNITPLKPVSPPKSPVVVNDTQKGISNTRTLDREVLPGAPSNSNSNQKTSTAAQPQSNPAQITQSHPTDFVSQLQLSLSSLPEVDQGYVPSQAALSQFSSYAPLPANPKLGRGEYVVLVGLSVGQQEAYLQNINNKSRIIQKFCNGELHDDPQAKNKILELLGTSRRIATHLDLATDEVLNWEKQDLGYALLHPKFQFLKAFFDTIRHQSLSVAVLAEAGKTLDILELFLKALKIRCRRTDGFNTVPALSSNEVDGSVNVLLAPTGTEGARVLGSHTSLVIGLDSTFNAQEKQVEKFRAHSLEVGRDAPILRLVAVNTVEHVKLFLPSQTKHYLSQLMSYVAILRQQAGNLPAAYTNKIDAANIAKTIIKSSESDIEVPLITPDILELPIYDTDSQSCTQKSVIAPLVESSQGDESYNSPPALNSSTTASEGGAVPSVAHAGEKRRWEEASQEVQVAGTEEFPEKKRKVVNGLSTPNEALEITHISETQPHRSQNSQNPMEIDSPERRGTRRGGTSLVALQAQESAEQHNMPTLNSQESVIALAIREHENGEAGVSEDRVTGARLDSMEGVAYDKPREPVQIGNKPAVGHAVTGLVPAAPIAVQGDAVQVGDTENGVVPDSVLESEKDLFEGRLNTEIEPTDAEDENDGFKYPLFEMPSKLPLESTLLDLSADALRDLLLIKTRELNQWVNSTSRLQLRYEEMRKEVKSLTADLKTATSLDIHTKERMTRLNAEVVHLKDERKQLRQDLQDARAALLSSDKPDVVKMEELRSNNARLNEELGSVKRQLESAKSDAEYAREAYQTATREGGERSKEAEELRLLNEELERKADERAVKLRELQFESQNRVKDQEIDKLKHVLAEREERIRRLESERNSIGFKGGRPLGTRATSVPRRGSPSTSRTSSPGPTTIPAPVGRDHHPTRPLHIQNAARRGNKE